MKNFTKLAVLFVTALAVSATYAHATTLVGIFVSSAAPGTVVEVPGTPTSSASSFSLSFTGGSIVGVCDPATCVSNTGTLGSLGSTPTVYSFTTGGITGAGSTGLEIWSDGGVSFWATGFGPIDYGMDASQSVELFGYYQGGSYSPSSIGTDTVVDDGIGGIPSSNIEEDLTASPIPEPSSLTLLGTGLLGAAGMLYRRRITA